MVQETKGNEGTERSGEHDEKQRIKDRALGDTAGGCVPGGQVGFTFNTVTQKQRDDRYEHTCVLYRSTALFLDNGSKNLQCFARMALNVGANVTVYPHIQDSF